MCLKAVWACAFAAFLVGVIPAQPFAMAEKSYLNTRNAGSFSDGIFLKRELQNSAYELVAAHLARQKATRHDIRVYAERLIRDHGIRNAALLQLMSAKNVEVPTRLRAADRERMQQLSQLKGRRLDQSFLKEAKRLNSSDMRLLREQASRTADNNIRTWVHFFLKVDAVHEQVARSLLLASLTDYKMRIIRPSEEGYRMPIVRPRGRSNMPVIFDLMDANATANPPNASSGRLGREGSSSTLSRDVIERDVTFRAPYDLNTVEPERSVLL